MIGYSQETLRLVASSPRVPRCLRAPALTQAQIAKLVPTIIVRSTKAIDESQLRREWPTLQDLAKLTPLQKWRRGHTERLIEPAPGSGIVQRGEVSLPWRKYIERAVHGQMPGPLRVHAETELFEHNLAPCEQHVTVPYGEESISWKEVKRRYITEARYKYVTQATHLHETTISERGEELHWTCRICQQTGMEDYTLDTLSRTQSIVYQRCVKCSNPDFKPWLDRRTFLKWGIGSGLGYAAWVSHFGGGFIPIPFVPPAHAVADTFYVATTGSDTTGTGSSASPWRTYEKARQNMVADDGDAVLGRSGNYPEFFGTTTQFPKSTAFNVATIVGADTGHVPIFTQTGDQVTIRHHLTNGTPSFVIFRQLKFDCQGGARLAYAAGASHHNRIDRCEGYNKITVVNGMFVFGRNHEVTQTLGHDIGTAGTDHHIYLAGPDNLIDRCESLTTTGYLVQMFSDAVGEGVSRNIVRASIGHNVAGRGLLVQPDVGNGADVLLYNNIFYGCNGAAGAGTIRLRRSATTNCGVYNNTVVDNGNGGIINGLAADPNKPQATRLRNNISVGNTGFQFTDNSGNWDVVGATNSWQIAGFSAGFVNQAGHDYHLTLAGSSQSINQGSDESAKFNSSLYDAAFRQSPPLDYDQIVRPVGIAWDIGAYEFGTAPPTPILSVTPASLTFQANAGGSNPVSQALTITDTAATGTMSWTVSDTASWLSVAPSSGTGNTGLTASVDITGLTAAIYTGSIVVTAPGATGSPATISVTLTVLPTTSPSHGRGGRRNSR